MEVVFKCPHCRSTIEADSDISGHRAECPACNEIVLVPAPGIEMGMEISGFRIEKRLGVGGMGEVFKAIQIAMDRPVALKILPPALTMDASQVDRFIQEVRMAAKLEHTNIVTAFDAGQDAGYHYLAMSFVDGEDLDHRLKRDKRLGEREALEIALKIANALEYAWEKFQILHRDIKPANIMITNDGEVKLMDMGIAKSLSEDSNLTMKGMLVGTPFYMSPEQATANASIDCRSDIYSLGATLYHFVTGKRPFEGPNAMAVIAKHISETAPAPRSLNASLSAHTEELIQKMMARKADDRFENWAQLQDAIKAILAGQSPMTVLAMAPTIAQNSDELGLTVDADIGLKSQTTAETPPISAPTVVAHAAAATTPVADTAADDETVLAGGPEATSATGVKWGMFGAAAAGVLVIVILCLLLISIVKSIDREDKETEIAKLKEENRQEEVGKDIDLGIKKYEHRELSRDDLQKMMNMADDFAEKNPGDIAAIRERYENIQKFAKESKLPVFEMQAANKLKTLDKRQHQTESGDATEIMDQLERQAAKLAESHLYIPAAMILEDFSGSKSVVKKTSFRRGRLAKRYRRHAAKEAPMEVFLRKCVRLLLDDKLAELERVMRRAKEEEVFEKEDKEAWRNLLPIITIVNHKKRTKRGGRRPLLQAEVVRAYHAYAEGRHAEAERLLRKNTDLLLVQVIIGEMQLKKLRGTWQSTEISGKNYSGKVKELKLRLEESKIRMTVNGGGSDGEYWVLGKWLHFKFGDHIRAWRIRSLREGRLTLDPQVGVQAMMSRQDYSP